MKYSREQLIDALYAEHVQYCEEYDLEEGDLPPDEMLAYYKTLTLEELVEETSTDDKYLTLDDYMEYYSQ